MSDALDLADALLPLLAKQETERRAIEAFIARLREMPHKDAKAIWNLSCRIAAAGETAMMG